MIGVVREIPETIKIWSENRDQLYDFISSGAAGLVVSAFVTGLRPSESLAMIAHAIGLYPVAD